MNSNLHLRQMPAFSLRRWCLACASGELLGLCGAFALLASARTFGADGFDPATPPAIRWALGLAVCTLEGGVLGALQSKALKRALHDLSVPRFAAMTALPAALVWAAVLSLTNVGTANSPVPEPPMAMIALAGGLGGLSGGLLIGACQAFALAPVVGWGPARIWIAASASGWTAGLAIIMVATTLQTEMTPMILVATLAVVGAGLGGLALGLASWWGARRLARPGTRAP